MSFVQLFNKRGLTRLAATALTIAMIPLATGCGGASDGNATSSDANDVKSQTVKSGTLTIATGQPAYSPWVLDNKPESGKGYEAAISYELANRLGFDKSHVKWVRTSFEDATTPGTKDWDLNIQQYSITPERKQAVDFSPSYYNVKQSILTRKDSKYAKATKLSEFKPATVGAMVGSTSYDFAKSKVKDDIKTFNDNAALAQALDADQIDAIVLDTPTAKDMVKENQVKDAMVVGQIPGSDDPEGTGFVLPKGSKLTPTVTKALNAMKKDGTLDKLQKQWLAEYTTDVPVLK
ncbi:polar amino acid transport system substrate-binding protein [Bifidobacterium bohemicum]|uniref:Amino acid ABC transporter substrate-binding protein n=1 Tax=Bifidobacterium bohemicum DSM 22767 TaxID=1437606 RepID=A0A086ZEF8_9BIFI|nr:ABC transporter substrate-binding protein [Bifidobacterium bohemicum]KFI44908.1 amino acid ABC transporter substrate-binding protein [Bifidobacterium bohemicum DSM 22767]SCB97043.1 polar amino acid transport system substrate-binding protein [Bifidobacterium bohemicum]